jgi:hypothetical protein
VISWWGEDILAKGSLVVSFFLTKTAALFDGMLGDPTPRMHFASSDHQTIGFIFVFYPLSG